MDQSLQPKDPDFKLNLFLLDCHIIHSKSSLSKPRIKQAFKYKFNLNCRNGSKFFTFTSRFFSERLVYTISSCHQKNKKNNSKLGKTKSILIKQIIRHFIEGNLNKKSEFSFGEGAEYNSLCSSQSHLKNCFWSSLTEPRPQFYIQSLHWFLLLCVTALVNMKDQNSWHRGFRRIQCLALAEAIENPSLFRLRSRKKNTADKSKNLLKYFSWEKLLMRQKSSKNMAINIFKDFCKY